jgi:hypothetical protein
VQGRCTALGGARRCVCLYVCMYVFIYVCMYVCIKPTYSIWKLPIKPTFSMWKLHTKPAISICLYEGALEGAQEEMQADLGGAGAVYCSRGCQKVCVYVYYYAILYYCLLILISYSNTVF